jgi:hypothetical protein
VDEFFPRTPSFDRDGLAEESEHLDDLSKPIAQVTTHVFASKGGPTIPSTSITVCGDGPREDLPTRNAQAYNHAVPIMLDIEQRFVVGPHPAPSLWALHQTGEPGPFVNSTKLLGEGWSLRC